MSLTKRCLTSTQIAIVVVAMGGIEFEIGSVIWNTSDLDTGDASYPIRFADLNNDGKKDGVIVGLFNSGLFAYHPNGTVYWSSTDTSNIIYEIEE